MTKYRTPLFAFASFLFAMAHWEAELLITLSCLIVLTLLDQKRVSA
jgi:hypothetical protein